ncbi:ABC transporter permease [Candidatus Arthromitus sp. SFB-rat-Yit]|uniref:ABC transporter permease n=1 Tax=Candidatus Arthromitus sp. SFB-rat-Yit TaxID=1041504 RepID=UPI000227A396|nr:ABC transporter permease [Candidatus Arthromitus sp. SFB-rat-Yit]BAK81491.1 ABC-type Na+ efflux pump, permease component [Candidatus Arthromitus sp. SFB-rat-Yit]
MNKFFIIAAYNFRDIIGRNFFKISTLVISLLIIIVSILPDLIIKFNFISKDKSEYLIYISDPKNYIFKDDLELNLYIRSIEKSLDNNYYVKLVDKGVKEDELKEKLYNGGIDGYIDVVSKSEINIFTKENYPEIKFILDRYILNQNSDLNISYPNYNVESLSLFKNKVIGIIKNYTYPFLLTIFIYMIFILYGQFISMNVNIERTSKIMDIFITKVKFSTIILGKLFGYLLAALIQLIYFIIILFLITGMMSNKYFPLIKEIIVFDGLFVLKYISYFVLGFMIYGLLFVFIGSVIDKIEELSLGIIPIVFLISIGYFLSMLNLQFPNNYFKNILVCIPFFAPFVVITESSFILYKDIFASLIMLITIVILIFINISINKQVIKFRGTNLKKNK